MRRYILLAICVGFVFPWIATAQNRLFFQAPYGVGGTYNLYELRGIGDHTISTSDGVGRFRVLNPTDVAFHTGDPKTMLEADAASSTTFEPFSGRNHAAHLAAFSGQYAAQENSLAAAVLGVTESTFALIGLTDDEYFGGGESRTAPPTGSSPGQNLQFGCAGIDCTAEQLAGFAGQPDDAVNDGFGWEWTNGEPYDFQAWNGALEPNDFAHSQGAVAGTGEDAVEVLRNGKWNDIGDGDGIEEPAMRPYLYEYETRSPVPLAIANELQLSPTAEKTPGGTGGNGFMSIREVHNGNKFVSGNAGAVDLLFAGGEREVNYASPVINFNNISGGAGGGQFDGDSDFGLVTLGAVPPGDINNFAVRAHGFLVIDATGQYTFDVNTDDSGELWIYGKTFESVTDGVITPHGSLAFLENRGAADTLGVITLTPGEYEFEFVMNEIEGGAAAELSAARGAFTAFSPADFFLVGDDVPGAIQLGDGIFNPEPIPGDSDQDGDVDISDLNNVRNHFDAAGQDILGDVNGDHRVDVLDLNLVRDNFGTRAGQGATVPEPLSLGLAGIAIGVFSLVAWRDGFANRSKPLASRS